MEGKEFCLVNDCCSKKCFEKFDEEDQKEIFEKFWLTASYNKQNFLLYGLMKRNSNEKKKIKNNIQNGNMKFEF